MAMRKRLTKGPPQLRQAYMRLILESVTMDHQAVRLEGSPDILEKLALNGPSDACAEVLSFAPVSERMAVSMAACSNCVTADLPPFRLSFGRVTWLRCMPQYSWAFQKAAKQTVLTLFSDRSPTAIRVASAFVHPNVDTIVQIGL